MYFDVFLFISFHISLVQFSPSSAEADIRWDGKMAGHLMASCARNICAKNIKIGKSFFTWQSLMFGTEQFLQKKTTTIHCNAYHDFLLTSLNMSTAYISVQKYVQM